MNNHINKVLEISLNRAMTEEMINDGTMANVIDAMNDILESLDA